jgi:signal peptidase II
LRRHRTGLRDAINYVLLAESQPTAEIFIVVHCMLLKNRYFWLTAGLGLALDRITKMWVVKSLVLHQSIVFLPGVLNLTYEINQGAAFSMFQGAIWLRWLSLVVSIGLMALAWFGPRVLRWEQVGYGLILSGALGNGIDRFVLGHVIDFLDLRLINFPWVFNLADSFINIGLACLIIATFKRPADPPTEKSGRL